MDTLNGNTLKIVGEILTLTAPLGKDEIRKLFSAFAGLAAADDPERTAEIWKIFKDNTGLEGGANGRE